MERIARGGRWNTRQGDTARPQVLVLDLRYLPEAGHSGGWPWVFVYDRQILLAD